MAVTVACTRPAGMEAEISADDLRLPTGLALASNGRWLYVTNGNWDLEDQASSLVVLHLEAVDRLTGRAVASLPEPGVSCTRDRTRPTGLLCPVANFMAGADVLALPNGAGNMVVDRPFGESGPDRVLLTSRFDSALTWIDVDQNQAEPRFDCGAEAERFCDGRHIIWSVPREPSRVALAGGEHRYAYVPHLRDRQMTLIQLNAAEGPRRQESRDDFFRVDPFDDGQELGGGFDVVNLPCDPATGYVPAGTDGCRQPFSVVSHRYWPGLRSFTVEAGFSVVDSLSDHRVFAGNLDAASGQPLMGSLAVENPALGDRLLVVNTTPPALTRLDTSLDDSMRPRFTVMASIPMCGDPNLVVVHRPRDAAASVPLAFVSCPAEAAVAVVDLARFEWISTISVGEGANEMVVDPTRQLLFVANTGEHTVSVVELDRGRAQFGRELVVLAGANAPVSRGGPGSD